MSRLSALCCRITLCPLGKSRLSVHPTCMPQRCSSWSSKLAPAHLFWMLAQASHTCCTSPPNSLPQAALLSWWTSGNCALMCRPARSLPHDKPANAMDRRFWTQTGSSSGLPALPGNETRL